MPRGVPRAGFRNTKNRQAAATQLAVEKAKESRFSINDRFQFVEEMIGMLAMKLQPSVVITGPGGLGKSFVVTKALEANGLKDISALDEFQVGDRISAKAFRVVKGYVTPKGLYRLLFENRRGVLVFDDTDSTLLDPVSSNLLKAALDSYSKRIITWRAETRDEDLPTSFEFEGRVVFISNMTKDRIDQAVLTRSMVVDLSMTNAQKIDRMRYLCTQKDFMPEYEPQFKSAALDLIESLQDSVDNLSLRTLIQVTKIAKKGGPRWKDLAEYTIC